MFKNRIKGFIIGAIGSVAGLMAMRLYWQKVAPQVRDKVDLGGKDAYPNNMDLDDISMVDRQPDSEESPTAVIGNMAYTALTDEEPSESMSSKLSNMTHWGYGILQGGLYGAARAANGADKGLDLRGGAAHALGLWLLGDEVTVPMLGLQEGPTAVTPTTHLNRLGAHLAYGLATAAATQILNRVL
ncbi:MAG: hypothetical protein H6659_17930 [Ardenticatenaceae bacterium]|nr:hypothetical protein [Ardenticatenaceae bacterium]